MKIKRSIFCVIVLILLAVSVNVEAASLTADIPPATLPWSKGVIDRADDVYLGKHVSIDHYSRNGRAYISYYDETHGNLKLAYEVSPGTGNCPGNANWECETVDNGGLLLSHDVGKYSSIDVIDALVFGTLHYAKIGISYFDYTDKSLKFAMRSCNFSGGSFSCSWTKTEVDDDTGEFFPDTVGEYTSFHFGSSATPVIFYHQRNSLLNKGQVKIAVGGSDGSGSCSAGWDCEVVGQSLSSTSYGTHISAEGNSVAYYDGENDQLMLATPSGSIQSTSCGIINYWNCVVIDSDGDVGKFVSMADSKMVYYDLTNGDIKYASYTTGSGNCGGGSYNCYAVDHIGISDGDIGLSMTMDKEDQPIIAYQDFSEDMAPTQLKIARPFFVYGDSPGNCGDVPPGYLFFYWTCKLIDGGGSWVNEADYAAVTVSPAGLATVAYYEIDDYYVEGHLKVARQHFMNYLPLINR